MKITRISQNYLKPTTYLQSENLEKQQYQQHRTLPHPNFQEQNSGFSSNKSLPNELNWSNLIREHISQGSPRKALILYNQIRPKKLYILGYIPLIFKACASIPNLSYGKGLHCESIKTGVDSDVMIGTSLVNMYSKCGNIVDAGMVFDSMPERNAVTWNAMIGGYFRNGDTNSALILFEKMVNRTPVTWIEMIDGFAKRGNTDIARGLFNRVPPELKNVVTWSVMVEGYTRNGEMEAARELFEEMPERNFFVWSSMISGYFKKGGVNEARAVFNRIPIRNLVNWNSLVSGYAQNGFCEEALEAFDELQAEGFVPDEVTVTTVLSACAQLGELDAGKRIHRLINENGIKLNHFVMNSLLDMYAKCGDLMNARFIFDRMVVKNSACWNAMISGFAIHGQSEEALKFFRRMEDSNENPDEITILSVLSACAHGGFVDEGLEIFSKMVDYGLVPGIRHYGSLVDMLGRAGRLKEAYDLIKEMPMKPNDAVWGALLGACRIYSDPVMVDRVMEEVSTPDHNVNSGDDSHYVLVSSLYAASDKWEKAEKMRMIMVQKGLQKIRGSSSIMVE